MRCLRPAISPGRKKRIAGSSRSRRGCSRSPAGQNLEHAKGNESAAIESLQKAIEIGIQRDVSKSEIARLHVLIGGIHLERGRWEDAERNYREGLAVFPESYLALEHIAEIAACQKRYDEALTLYRRVIEQTGDPTFVQCVGDIHAERGESKRAAQCYSDALAGYLRAVEEGDIGHYRQLAEFYIDVRPEPKTAVEWARKDLEVRATGASYDVLAWALYAAGDYDQAEDAIAKALAFPAPGADLHYHAGRIAYRRGDKDAARMHLQKALAANPRFDAADEARELLEKLD